MLPKCLVDQFRASSTLLVTHTQTQNNVLLKNTEVEINFCKIHAQTLSTSGQMLDDI